MRISLPRLQRLTRPLALLLLLLGLVMNPVLAFIGDVHDLDHVAASADLDTHGHAHADDHTHGQVSALGSDTGSDGGDTAADDESGEALHGLLHLSHGAAPSIEYSGAMLLALVPLTSTLDVALTASPAPVGRISETFRPPIS